MHIIEKKYFKENHPVNAVGAYATLEFDGTVDDGEIVVIGNDIYEFDTDDETIGGNIIVDVSLGQTASDAVDALLDAINSNNNSQVIAEKISDSTKIKITAKVLGVFGNDIDISTDCENGTWSGNTLENGINGTFAGEANWIYFYDEYMYISIMPNDKSQNNWRKAELQTF